MPTQTTRYRKRDLRAADMLAIILIGVGVLVLGFSALQVPSGSSQGATRVSAPTGTAADAPVPAPEGEVSAKGRSLRRVLVALTVGAAFLLLGLALELKVRALVRAGGYEGEEYPGVPE